MLDDLTASTDADGNPFDLTDYPYNEYGSIQLVNFAEYCYGYAANLRNNYGLYIYIYNPQALNIDEDSVLNKVQLAVSWNADGEPEQQDKFDIVFCNKSGGDYAELFYKYRIVDKVSSYDGKTIAERVNSNGRKYSITGVEHADAKARPTRRTTAWAGRTPIRAMRRGTARTQRRRVRSPAPLRRLRP